MNRTNILYVLMALLVASAVLFAGCTQPQTESVIDTPKANININPNEPEPSTEPIAPVVDTTPDGSVETVAGQKGAVRMENFSFKPDSVTIEVGSSVVWYNSDSAQHSVVSDTGLFESGFLPKGQTFEYTFSTPGTYTYHCGPHPNMIGTVIVK